MKMPKVGEVVEIPENSGVKFMTSQVALHSFCLECDIYHLKMQCPSHLDCKNGVAFKKM
jgi:hypothetical protein